jgi:hypothetical protein
MQPTRHQLSERDLQRLKQALSRRVPEEISSLILDFAGCWQPTVFTRHRSEITEPFNLRAPYISVPITNRHRLRKIVIEQGQIPPSPPRPDVPTRANHLVGWSGKYTLHRSGYFYSHTWFRVAISRDSSAFLRVMAMMDKEIHDEPPKRQKYLGAIAQKLLPRIGFGGDDYFRYVPGFIVNTVLCLERHYHRYKLRHLPDRTARLCIDFEKAGHSEWLDALQNGDSVEVYPIPLISGCSGIEYITYVKVEVFYAM